MIAQELEVSLHMAFVEARQQRHEFITVEHLLLALLDNPTAFARISAISFARTPRLFPAMKKLIRSRHSVFNG
jgi:ATP-dependent Clp protease ATP-binding subunit ClpA